MMNCGWNDKYRCGYQEKSCLLMQHPNKEIKYLKHNTNDDKTLLKEKITKEIKKTRKDRKLIRNNRS